MFLCFLNKLYKNTKKNLLVGIVFTTTTYGSDFNCNSFICSTNISDGVLESILNSSVKVRYSSDRVGDNAIYISSSSGFNPPNMSFFYYNRSKDTNSMFSSVPIPPTNLTINITSDLAEIDSGNAFFVGALMGDINLISDGINGINGKSTLQLCASAMSSGQMGDDLRISWESNTRPDQDKCSVDDISRIYSSFTCPAGFIKSPDSFVNIKRYVQVRKCLKNNPTLIRYISKEQTCSASEVNQGIVRSPDLDTESLQCFFNGTCDLLTEKKTYSSSIITLNPTRGTKANLSGNTTVIAYNYENLTYSNFTGTYGIGGTNDLSQMLGGDVIEDQYCYKALDYDNYDDNTFYQDNPYLIFHKIRWEPIIEGGIASDGLPGQKKNGTTTVIKGIDNSLRYWLGNDNFN